MGGGGSPIGFMYALARGGGLMARACGDIFTKEKIYRDLRRRIVTRILVPGEIVSERNLAMEFGVSRTPVREALHALYQDGWVSVMPRRGAVVCPVARLDVEEFVQLRMLVATACFDMAKGRVGGEDIAFLRTHLERQREMAETGGTVEFMALDREFHISMVRLSGNKRLTRLVEGFGDDLERMGIEAMMGANRLAHWLEHALLVDAIAAGDMEKAKQIIHSHIIETREQLLRSINKVACAEESDGCGVA